MPSIGIGLGIFAGQQGAGAAPLESESIYAFQPTNENTLVNRTHILVFDVAELVIPDFDVSGVQILVAGRVDNLYIGPADGAGDAYDRSSVTQVLFGGQPGVDQAYNATTLSDVVNFTWDKTSNLVVTFYLAAGNTATDARNGVDWYNVNAFNVAGSADIDGADLISTDALANISEIILYGN